jgi:hypothetical protein
VSKRIFQIAAAVILTFAALTPIAECFDHWDKNVVPANDTELRVTAWFAFAGLVLTTAKLIRHVVSVLSARKRSIGRVELGQGSKQPDWRRVLPTSSPPLIPLRI